MQAVPATFYNRPGADDALLTAELARCHAIVTGPTVDARALRPPVGVAEPLLASEAGCMAARGWRHYRLSAAERAMLARLPAMRQASLLRRATAARRPAIGTLLPDAASPSPGLLR